jgi:hypothetical protein
VVGGVGAVGLAVGAIFGLRAIGRMNDSKGDCDANDFCGPDGKTARLDARSAGTVSTIGFAAGGVLVAAGATMFLLGKPHRAPTAATLAASPVASRDQAGIALWGAF